MGEPRPAAAGLLLLAVAIVRLAVPDRSRLRPMSIEGLAIPPELVETGQTVVREAHWSPPTDVYVLGWNYRLGAAAAGAEPILLDGETAVFRTQGGDVAPMPTLPSSRTPELGCSARDARSRSATG